MLRIRALAMSGEPDNPLLGRWGERRRRPRRTLPVWVWPLSALAVIAALVFAVWNAHRSHSWRPPSGAPHFSSCTFGGRLDAWCARLGVAADPRKPRGRTISLRIAVLPATKRPAAGALFYLEGGPGGAATASALRVNDLFAEVLRTRDVVLVDQRGTGGSGLLACPNVYVREKDAKAVTAYLRACLASHDADPRLYTTSVVAHDLETVRRTLGYGKIDLYGGSYGVTLAEAFVHRYPESVRSLVLDSGSLPNVRIYDASARNAERALDLQLARCAASPACKRAYPDPRRQLDALLARPPRVVSLPSGKVVMSANDVAWTVDWLSETAESADVIPFALNAAAHGDFTTLAETYGGQLGGSNLDSLSRLLPFWSIVCSEPWASFDPGRTARAGRGSYLLRAAVARARLFRSACRVVPRNRARPDVGVVRAPTLLLSGGADPLDPPANLRGWRHVFPNGRSIVVAGAGHGTIEYACVQTLIARFVARAGASGIDASCARHVPLPAFLTG